MPFPDSSGEPGAGSKQRLERKQLNCLLWQQRFTNDTFGKMTSHPNGIGKGEPPDIYLDP